MLKLKLIDIGIKIGLLLFFACALQCKSTEKKDNDKLSEWKHQQLRHTYQKSIEEDESFISLGIAMDKDLTNAVEKAKIESSFQMPEIIETYITTCQQVCEESGITGNKTTASSLIYARSEIKVPDLNYNVVSKYKHMGLYYVAVNGSVRREKCNESITELYNFSTSSRLDNFRKNVNEKFNQVTKNIYLENK